MFSMQASGRAGVVAFGFGFGFGFGFQNPSAFLVLDFQEHHTAASLPRERVSSSQ
jgi:hypothetical protein